MTDCNFCGHPDDGTHESATCNVQIVVVQPAPHTYKGIAYANAYAMTRHYGGPEEGGWWYNAGEPLASMPIPATFTVQHEIDEHGECAGCHDDEGNRLDFCRNTEWEADKNAAESAKAYLEAAFADRVEGDIYSVRGGTQVLINIEPMQAQAWPERTPRYE